MTDKNVVQSDHSETKPADDSRRTFLKKAGLVALYTPPAITMLMQPSQASMMKSPGGQHRKYNHVRHDQNKNGNGGNRHGMKQHGGRRKDRHHK